MSWYAVVHIIGPALCAEERVSFEFVRAHARNEEERLLKGYGCIDNVEEEGADSHGISKEITLGQFKEDVF